MPQSHQTSAFKDISTAMSSSLETVYQKIVNFAKSIMGTPREFDGGNGSQENRSHGKRQSENGRGSFNR
jgi:hypothetical protein